MPLAEETGYREACPGLRQGIEMRSIAAVDGSAAPSLGGRERGWAATPDTGPTTALVAVAPARPPDAELAVARRPLTAFVVQLIATRCGEPQTRARRRAETAHAIAHYAAAEMAPSPPVVLRWL